jgi:DNA-binding MarR family transcriptional regulator
MDNKEMERGHPAFLLAQLGAHAANQFAERLAVLQLTPADAGILRMLRVAAAISQQELSEKLRIHPSRLVAILDNLERRQLVERKPNPNDRRLYSLHLTRAGGEMFTPDISGWARRSLPTSNILKALPTIRSFGYSNRKRKTPAG